MNRDHNKKHHTNHHTVGTIGDINSANDPIASLEHPFNGDFYLSNSIHIDGGLLKGNLAISGEILNCSASKTKEGIIRIATSNESDAGLLDYIAISPRDIDYISQSGIAHNLSGDYHTDVEINNPENGQILVRDGDSWINVNPIGVPAICTNSESLSGSNTIKAISPFQLYTEIGKRKALFVNGGNILAQPPTPTPSSIEIGTLLFQTYTQEHTQNAGNATGTVYFYGLKVWEWKGVTSGWVHARDTGSTTLGGGGSGVFY